jgi:TonB family protein
MRPMKRFAYVPLLGFFIATLSLAVVGQTPENVSEWQPLRPAGEEFSVIMPKDFVFETGKMPYHKLEVNTRLYLSTTPNGPVYAVVSLSGIKSNPALYSEMERLNSYVDAFKKFLGPRLKGKDAIAKLTLKGGKTLNGHAGREYQMTIGDLSGPAEVYGTRKRFYAVAFLNNKKAESLQDRFMSSFFLPDYVAEAPAKVAAQATQPEPDLPPEVQVGKKPDNPSTAQPQGQEGTTDSPGSTKPDETPNPTNSPTKKPISGGVLNGKAISLPKPEYPAAARAAKASGTVSVQVVIDEYGTVISANAVSGHPLLQQASINAAFQARFSPTSLMGEPVKVTGMIVYNFVAQ